MKLQCIADIVARAEDAAYKIDPPMDQSERIHAVIRREVLPSGSKIGDVAMWLSVIPNAVASAAFERSRELGCPFDYSTFIVTVHNALHAACMASVARHG